MKTKEVVKMMEIEVSAHEGGLMECNACGPLGVTHNFIDAAFAHIADHNTREMSNA